MNIQEWADHWSIPPIAVFSLQQDVLGTLPKTFNDQSGFSESAISQRVRIKASQHGARMYRNNCGVAFREDGTPIRFGLCNDSQKIHNIYRSSDLIGITPILIKPEHVGLLIGQFTSWEIKKQGWKYNANDKHQVCQNNWNNLVVSLGGDGRFITSEQDI